MTYKMTHKWTLKLAGLAVFGAGLLGGATSAHAASTATASMDCDGTLTANVSHAEWGQSVSVTVDGVTHTVERPDGWWDGDGPHDRWSGSTTFATDGSAAWSWTDHEAAGVAQGGGTAELAAACTTTTTTVPPLPQLVIDPPVSSTDSMMSAPLPPLPAGVEVDVPTTTCVPMVVSVAPNGDEFGPCRITMEANDPRFDEPTTTVAEVQSMLTLPATGPNPQTGGMVWVAAVVLIVGLVALFGARRQRPAVREPVGMP